ncbi:MAG: T9SS type A sorting domain-containing protein [Bacteroidota bacterium]
MRKKLTPLLCLLLSIVSQNAFATIFTATQDGNWSNASTWGGSGIPSQETDEVIIDGYQVTLSDEEVTIGFLTVTNASSAGFSQLHISGTGILVVKNGMDVISENIWEGIEVKLTDSGTLNVESDLDIIRTADNTALVGLQLKLYNSSRLNVSGNFTYDSRNTGGINLTQEIISDNSSIITVAGATHLYTRNVKDLEWRIQGNATVILSGDLFFHKEGGENIEVHVRSQGLLQVTGKVSMNNSGGSGKAELMAGPGGGTINVGGIVEMISSTANQLVQMNADGDSSNISVSGDITLDAQSEGDVSIDLDNNGSLSIGGNFNRVDNTGMYGSLQMANGGLLVYNGTNPQIIACDHAPGSGTDAFSADNIKFDNPSGFILEGPMVVYDSLELTNGVIETDSVRTLTIADGAKIKGGSTDAYINGPITKVGSTGGASFVFPTGNEDRYAPIEISQVVSPTDTFTARYMGCPPRLRTSVESPLVHISSVEYWDLTGADGNVDEVDVTLYWTDAAFSGIDDPSSLAIASFDPNNGLWSSLGNGGTTVDGATGSLRNDSGCPPRLLSSFTFGATLPTTNSLPVELVRFTARQRQGDIQVQWVTTNEVNNSHFEVERSIDGMDFEIIGTVRATTETEGNHYYQLMDERPYFGRNYYRLKQVDRTGEFEYSRVVEVNIAGVIGGPIIYPNPVHDRLQVRGADPEETTVELQIFDQQGRLYFSQTVALENGNLDLATKDLNLHEAGHYLLMMHSTSGMYSLPLLKIED